jgi:dsRNA-specific ribonuclease
MLAGGPSAFYAAELARHETDAILITGYQDEESPGRALLNLAEQSGPRLLRLGDHVVDVRCTFATYSLSAHADRMQMVGLIEALQPRTVVLVHGDIDAKRTLAASLSCNDIVHGEEGVQITRRYPRRTHPLLQGTASAVSITPEAAAALIGPATGEPLRAAHLAEAWFGKPVDPFLQERFVQQLEQTGLIRRDDHRRALLWPLTQAAPASVPSPQELLFAETLKAENPKGTLLEWCMRRRLDRPTMQETTDENGWHVIELEMEIEGKRVSSGPHQASVKKVAEQLAAKALLDCLRDQEQTVAAVDISEAQRLSVAQQNPKGKLLEFCTQHKLPRPVCKAEVVVDGYRCVATIDLSSSITLQSQPFQATRAKAAEQAAAADLYEKLISWNASRPEATGATMERPAGLSPVASVHAKPTPPRPDARMQLNQWRQQRHLVNFGYDLVAHHGPAHQPVFVMSAWAELPGGDRRITEQITAGSKKEAQLAAASALHALLEADMNFSGLWENLRNA